MLLHELQCRTRVRMLKSSKIGSSKDFPSGKLAAHGAQAIVDQLGGTAFQFSLTNLVTISMNHFK